MLRVQQQPAFWLRVNFDAGKDFYEKYASSFSELRATFFGMMLVLPPHTMQTVFSAMDGDKIDLSPNELAEVTAVTERFVVQRALLEDTRVLAKPWLRRHIEEGNVGPEGLAMVCCLAPELLCCKRFDTPYILH
jgi:hypothetical protein